MNLEELQKEAAKLKSKKEAVARDYDDYTLRKVRSNLFFDDETRVQFLANQRFPDEDKPADRYFNQDGTLFYMDDDGKFQKEFPDNDVVGFFKGTVAPNLVPAATFVADVGGGMAGAKAGFQIGQNLPLPPPYKQIGTVATTALGGLIGTFLSGGSARLGREALINSFYNVPPEELTAMMDDLEKKYIEDQIKEQTPVLNVVPFLKFYQEDGLRHLIKNVEFWINNQFRILNSFVDDSK